MINRFIIILALMILSSTIVNAGKINYTMYFVCGSNSMYPAMTCEDKLTINSFNMKTDKLIIGDAYCYYPDTRFYLVGLFFKVCHRLVNITEDGKYVFKGDNNDYLDLPIEMKYVQSHIIKVEKSKRSSWY